MNVMYTREFLVDQFDRLAPNLSDVPIKGYQTLTRDGIARARTDGAVLVEDAEEPNRQFWVDQKDVTFVGMTLEEWSKIDDLPLVTSDEADEAS